MLLGLVACTGFEPIRHDDRASAWVEFHEDLDAAVLDAAAWNLDLNLAMERDLHDMERLRSTCAVAAENDVALKVWPTLPIEEGYWPNQGNFDAFAAWTWQLVDVAREDCVHLDGVVVDMEMPYERAMELQDLVAEGATDLEVAEFLVATIDEDGFEQARRDYAELTQALQDEGLRVHVTTLPMHADDLFDGDETLALALWTPIQDIGWDMVSVQVYRSFFQSSLAAALEDETQEFSAGLISSYADTMFDHYGDRAALDLGTTGTVGIGVHAGLSEDELQADLAAALVVVPADHIAIYSLEGLDEHEDPAASVRLPSAERVEPDAATLEIRELFATLDALRDD